MKNKTIKVISCIVVLILAGIGGYVTGYRTAYNRLEKAQPNVQTETFYATITDIRDNNFSVEGMSVNDINYRGTFDFEVSDETKLVWRGTEMTISEFHIGDSVSITYSGEIQETSPARILDVVKIQLLDDEK